MVRSDVRDGVPRKLLQPEKLLLRIWLIHHVGVVDQAAQMPIQASRRIESPCLDMRHDAPRF